MPKEFNKYYFYFLIVFLFLFLSLVNINNYLTKTNVLGLSVKAASNRDYEFWESFLKENPEYIPGWIEIGRLDKVREIDPNYIIP